MPCEIEQHAQLREDLDLALHSMAQPLTVLRGALGALLLRGASAPEAGRYLEMSQAQVERLCDLITYTRSLLDAIHFEAASTTDLITKTIQPNRDLPEITT